MKRIILFAIVCILGGVTTSNAQVFWYENFGSCGSSSVIVTSYTGSYGAWTETTFSSASTYSNVWYVSGHDQGHIAGACSDDCGTSSGLGPSLHLGAPSTIGGDVGASYYVGYGTVIDATTDKRAESPTINCSGRTGITLSFYYIENGDSTLDDGSVYYYDGSSWSLLLNTTKTSFCSGGQGIWSHASVSLPASANNNANVKIGFRWVNNTDTVGTDPSYAVDSVVLRTAGGTLAISNTPLMQPSITLYPNPTNNNITLTATNLTGKAVSIKCYSLIGALVLDKTATVTNGDASTTIDLSHLQSGIYEVVVRDEAGQRFVRSVVKE